MPFPLVIGAAGIGAGVALVAWYCSLPSRRREALDDRCLDIAEQMCGVRDAQQLGPGRARRVIDQMRSEGDIPDT